MRLSHKGTDRGLKTWLSPLGFVNDEKTAQTDNVFVIPAADTYPFQLTQKAGEWTPARRQCRPEGGRVLICMSFMRSQETGSLFRLP